MSAASKQVREEIYFHSCDIRRQALSSSRGQSQQEAEISTRDSPFLHPHFRPPLHSPGVQTQGDIPISPPCPCLVVIQFWICYGHGLCLLSPSQPSSISQLKRQISSKNLEKGHFLSVATSGRKTNRSHGKSTLHCILRIQEGSPWAMETN